MAGSRFELFFTGMRFTCCAMMALLHTCCFIFSQLETVFSPAAAQNRNFLQTFRVSHSQYRWLNLSRKEFVSLLFFSRQQATKQPFHARFPFGVFFFFQPGTVKRFAGCRCWPSLKQTQKKTCRKCQGCMCDTTFLFQIISTFLSCVKLSKREDLTPHLK